MDIIKFNVNKDNQIKITNNMKGNKIVKMKKHFVYQVYAIEKKKRIPIDIFLMIKKIMFFIGNTKQIPVWAFLHKNINVTSNYSNFAKIIE